MTDDASEKSQLCQDRKDVLCSRGRLEMLAQQCERALELINHGRYQCSLKSRSDASERLLIENREKLESLLDVFTTALVEFQNALETFEVACTSTEEVPAFYLLEKSNHKQRLPYFRSSLLSWSQELTK